MTLEEDEVVSAGGEYIRKVWFAATKGDGPQMLAIFLDGEFYLQRMEAVSIIEGLITKREIPPFACVFVSHVNGEHRQRDLICKRNYARFIAEDVVGWASRRDSRIVETGALVAGVSLSGLAAAHAAIFFPSVFSYALCQSGSFWWLADNDIDMPPTGAKFWLSVGDEEAATNVLHPPTPLFQRISQIEGVRQAARRLKEAGGDVYYRVFAGGHGFEPWKEELGPALMWLLSPPVAV